MISLRMLLFILGLRVLWLGLVLSPRTARACSCPRMTSRTTASWSSPLLVILRDIHSQLLANYDCKDSTPPKSQTGARARGDRSSQDGFSQQQEAGPLVIPQRNCLHKTFRHLQSCRYPVPYSDAAQNYVSGHSALEAVSTPSADLRRLTTCRAATPSQEAAHRRHCRGLRPADRHGRPRVSRRGCPKRVLWYKPNGVAWGHKAALQR